MSQTPVQTSLVIINSAKASRELAVSLNMTAVLLALSLPVKSATLDQLAGSPMINSSDYPWLTTAILLVLCDLWTFSPFISLLEIEC